MAHMVDGKGPYPNKTGEFCGNYYPNSYDDFINPQEIKSHEEWLSRMRFGRPHPTEKYTIAQLIAIGWVGLYLKEDRPLLDFEIECPTPPKLLEPLQ